MVRSKLGAVRRAQFLASVLTLSAVSLSAQVVEKGRTYADLVATHPCNSGSSGRLARITDAQSSSSIGGGGGSTQVWAVCNGVDTWTLTAIGGGGGVSGLSTADGGTALADNAIVRGDGTTGIQGSAVAIADSTGNLQWEGTTADAFEGNFTFADPTADWTWAWGADGTLTGGSMVLSGKTLVMGDPTVNGDTRLVAVNNYFRVRTGDDLYFQTLVAGDVRSYRYDGAANYTAFLSGNDKAMTLGGTVGLANYATGVMKGTDASSGVIGTGIRWLQGGGSAVASATAMPLPTGRVFHVTGTTNITSITSTDFQSGVCIMLIFDDVLTFTDGSNLKLAGNFVTTTDDTISLCYDGTNWHEASRSIN